MPIGILLVSISITILSCEYKYNNLYDNSDYHFSLLISSCQRTFPLAFAARHEGKPYDLIDLEYIGADARHEESIHPRYNAIPCSQNLLYRVKQSKKRTYAPHPLLYPLYTINYPFH